MRAPGFYDDISEADYHADRDSLSVSGAKVLLKAPALFRWQQDHPVRKDVFDFGTAAHRLVLGVGCDLIVFEYDAEKIKSPKSTTAWKDRQAEVRQAGNVLLLPEEHAAVVAMADTLSSHTLAMRLLSEGRPEVSAYAIDEATGVMRRGRFDWLGPNVLTDYKTAASVDPRDLAGRYGAVKKWGYDMQAAWYTDLARDLGHPASAFAFIFQAKEPPYPVVVAYLRDDDLWDARQRNREALERFRDCTESGLWPGFLPDTSAAVLSLTDQTYYEENTA
jgi:hypothetical protein